jgi:hypothetical protein
LEYLKVIKRVVLTRRRERPTFGIKYVKMTNLSLGFLFAAAGFRRKHYMKIITLNRVNIPFQLKTKRTLGDSRQAPVGDDMRLESNGIEC